MADYFIPNSNRYPDFVSADSKLGSILGRSISDYRPVDDMYKPVYKYGVLGQRTIIGYKKISPQEKKNLFLE